MSFEPAIYGLIVAIVGGTVAGTATIITQKRAMVREVKENTEGRMQVTEGKIENMENVIKVKLENVELKINNQGSILRDLKDKEVQDLKKELVDVKKELSQIQLEGPKTANIKAEHLLGRLEAIEKRMDLLWERALTDETAKQRRERKESA